MDWNLKWGLMPSESKQCCSTFNIFSEHIRSRIPHSNSSAFTFQVAARALFRSFPFNFQKEECSQNTYFQTSSAFAFYDRVRNEIKSSIAIKRNDAVHRDVASHWIEETEIPSRRSVVNQADDDLKALWKHNQFGSDGAIWICTESVTVQNNIASIDQSSIQQGKHSLGRGLVPTLIQEKKGMTSFEADLYLLDPL